VPCETWSDERETCYEELNPGVEFLRDAGTAEVQALPRAIASPANVSHARVPELGHQTGRCAFMPPVRHACV
jgi:hypothetical protein